MVLQQVNRRLREEQDAEYQRSLEADRERERKRTADRAEEEARQLAAQQAQDAKRCALDDTVRQTSVQLPTLLHTPHAATHLQLATLHIQCKLNACRHSSLDQKQRYWLLGPNPAVKYCHMHEDMLLGLLAWARKGLPACTVER